MQPEELAKNTKQISDVMVTHNLVLPDGTVCMPERQRVGSVLTFGSYVGKARILRLHGAGTIDVERLSDGHRFRISGLSTDLVG